MKYTIRKNTIFVDGRILNDNAEKLELIRRANSYDALVMVAKTSTQEIDRFLIHAGGPSDEAAAEQRLARASESIKTVMTENKLDEEVK